jgi:hypothetical protein
MTRFNPSQKLKLVCIPKNINPNLIESIKSDVLIIAKYLNVNLPKIIIKKSVSGGRYYGRKTKINKRIVLGIKHGYTKSILLHEMLHHKGYVHGLKHKGSLVFEHQLKYDTFTDYYMKLIFNESEIDMLRELNNVSQNNKTTSPNLINSNQLIEV